MTDPGETIPTDPFADLRHAAIGGGPLYGWTEAHPDRLRALLAAYDAAVEGLEMAANDHYDGGDGLCAGCRGMKAHPCYYARRTESALRRARADQSECLGEE